MAERRMFARTIIDSDVFLDMPLSAQALYFHLSMRADDEGFVNNPRRIVKMVCANDDDLKLLIAKHFLIPFESGIVVIKHWRIHNYIQADRFHPTVYKEERKRLNIKENKAYTLEAAVSNLDTECIQDVSNLYPSCIQSVTNLDTECIQDGYKMDTSCIQSVSKMDTQVRLDKNRLDKNRLGECAHAHGAYQKVKLTDTEYDKLKAEYGDLADEAIEFLDAYISEKGYKSKSHYLSIRRWVIDAVKERKQKKKGRSDFDAELLELARGAYDTGNNGNSGS